MTPPQPPQSQSAKFRLERFVFTLKPVEKRILKHCCMKNWRATEGKNKIHFFLYYLPAEPTTGCYLGTIFLCVKSELLKIIRVWYIRNGRCVTACWIHARPHERTHTYVYSYTSVDQCHAENFKKIIFFWLFVTFSWVVRCGSFAVLCVRLTKSRPIVNFLHFCLFFFHLVSCDRCNRINSIGPIQLQTTD